MFERRFRGALGGGCWLGLYLLWCSEYRRRILGGRVVARCGELPGEIAGVHGWQIGAREIMPDHVHLFVRVGPTEAPAAVVRAFEGRTARLLRQEFAYVGRFAEVLGSLSYLPASVGYVSESTVRRDIEPQCDVVMAS